MDPLTQQPNAQQPVQVTSTPPSTQQQSPVLGKPGKGLLIGCLFAGLIIGIAIGLILGLTVLKPKTSTVAKSSDTQSSSSSSQSSADSQQTKDAERKTDINALHGQIEAYYAQYGSYPSLTNLNDSAFRAAKMKGLDAEALKDPEGVAEKLSNTPARNSYSYDVTASDDTSCEADPTRCAVYALTATFSDGKTYTKSNLN